MSTKSFLMLFDQYFFIIAEKQIFDFNFFFFFLGGKQDPVEKFKGTMGKGMTIYLSYIFKILVKAVKTVTFYPSHTWPCSLAWSPPKFKLVPPQLQNHSHKHNSRRYINRNG